MGLAYNMTWNDYRGREWDSYSKRSNQRTSIITGRSASMKPSGGSFDER